MQASCRQRPPAEQILARDQSMGRATMHQCTDFESAGWSGAPQGCSRAASGLSSGMPRFSTVVNIRMPQPRMLLHSAAGVSPDMPLRDVHALESNTPAHPPALPCPARQPIHQPPSTHQPTNQPTLPHLQECLLQGLHEGGQACSHRTGPCHSQQSLNHRSCVADGGTRVGRVVTTLHNSAI